MAPVGRPPPSLAFCPPSLSPPKDSPLRQASEKPCVPLVSPKMSAAFFSLVLSSALAQNCVSPPPAKDFNISLFEGAWYEIARIQTAGGAALQDFCVCTELIYSPTPGGMVGDTTTINSCRFLKPDAFYLNATSYLTNMTEPGHWLERYCEPSCPPASYNIIMEGQGMLPVRALRPPRHK